MSATIDTWAGGLGLLTGFCVIAAWLAIAGRPADAPMPAAELSLGAAANGELAVEPLGRPVIPETDLRAGDRPTTGVVSVRNQTPRRLDVRVRAAGAGSELDRAAWIRVDGADATLLRTRLGDARRWSRGTIRLAPGESAALEAELWIPGEAEGWQAARGDATLEFRAEVVGR